MKRIYKRNDLAVISTTKSGPRLTKSVIGVSSFSLFLLTGAFNKAYSSEPNWMQRDRPPGINRQPVQTEKVDRGELIFSHETADSMLFEARFVRLDTLTQFIAIRTGVTSREGVRETQDAMPFQMGKVVLSVQNLNNGLKIDMKPTEHWMANLLDRFARNSFSANDQLFTFSIVGQLSEQIGKINFQTAVRQNIGRSMIAFPKDTLEVFEGCEQILEAQQLGRHLVVSLPRSAGPEQKFEPKDQLVKKLELSLPQARRR